MDIPDIAFKTAWGIDGLTILCVAWVLKGTINPKTSSTKIYVRKVGILVFGIAAILSLSIFLVKWFG